MARELAHYLLLKAHGFPRATLLENCSLLETDNVRGQISEHIFAPNGGCCVYYPLIFFRNGRSFENWEIFNNYSPKWRWLAVDINRAAKRRGKCPTVATDTKTVRQYTPKKLIGMICSLVTDVNRDAVFSRIARR